MKLTELDCCVIASVWRDGPITAYGVRSAFRASTTASWSDSSGSIYPAIRRLLAAGLLTAETQLDRRGTQSLSLTTAGRAALQSWLLDLKPALGTPTPDPIRTRAQFITSLPPEDQQRFVANARDITNRAIAILEDICERNRDDATKMLDQLGTLGSIFELRARLQWLDLVVASVTSHGELLYPTG